MVGIVRQDKRWPRPGPLACVPPLVVHQPVRPEVRGYACALGYRLDVTFQLNRLQEAYPAHATDIYYIGLSISLWEGQSDHVTASVPVTKAHILNTLWLCKLSPIINQYIHVSARCLKYLKCISEFLFGHAEFV